MYGTIRKNIEDFNNTIIQFNLTDIYRTTPIHSRMPILFWFWWHGTFTKRDLMLGHKTNLHKYQNQSMFSDDNGFKLEIKNRKIAGKSPAI